MWILQYKYLLGSKRVPTFVMAEAVAVRRDADLTGALAELIDEGRCISTHQGRRPNYGR